MPKVIIQVQCSKQAFAYHPGHFPGLHGGFLVKGYGLAQGINDNVAILTLCDMAV